MELVGMAVALFCVGMFVGVASGMLGIGGGTIIVPILRLLFGLPAHSATATSLFTIIFTSVSGAAGHFRHKTCLLKLGLALGIGGALTSSVGVALAGVSPSWAIMVVAAIIIGYSAYNMLKKAIKLTPGKGKVKLKEKEAVAAPDNTFELTREGVLKGLGIGVIAGLASGYVGVGGGFIMVPLMTAWLGVPMRMASGTSLIAIIMIAIPGTISNALLGNIDYLAGILLTVGSIPGAQVGAKLASKVPERELRFAFAAFLGLGAIMLVLNELGILG